MELDAELISALKAAREYWGRFWKRELRYCWERAQYPYGLREYGCHFQRIRNTIGPTGLKAIVIK